MFLNLNEEEKQNLYKSGVFSLGEESIIGRQHSFNEKQLYPGLLSELSMFETEESINDIAKLIWLGK